MPEKQTKNVRVSELGLESAASTKRNVQCTQQDDCLMH